MTAAAFSNYLIYNVGGAEPSLIHLLNQKYPNDKKTIYSFEKPTIHKISPLRLNIPKDIEIVFIPRKSGFSFFPFIEYYLNRNTISLFFSRRNDDSIISSSIYAPIAINNFKGSEKYIFIQSDIDLGRLGNQEVGIKKLLKSIYNFIQTPFVSIFKKDLRKALSNSHVICNSNYTKSLLEKFYNHKNCTVSYPYIDKKSLIEKYKKKENEIEKKGIVFIGDAPHKGIHITESISTYFPEIPFYIFSKKVKQPFTKRNISYFPWVKDVSDAYKYAQLVIMPSQWEETFGRVARESYILKIPILVSNNAGLPEAVFHDKKCLVDDYKNPNAWVEKINKINL